MAKRTIDRVSLRYRLLKIYAIFVHWVFYRRIEVKFRDRIPKDRPVLLAPNHQNALMDAMAPLLTSRRDPVFLARADIFKNKFVAGILRFLKILPVYRIRDGANELGKNEAVFQEAMEVLMSKKSPVCIMPEGNHGNKRRLRPLVKGIFRVAFQAQETYGEQPGVVIVPVGLDYSKYTIFRGKLLIQFGEPIEVNEYYAAYLQNQAKTINMIRNRLAEELRKYMIDIQSEDHYEMYMVLRNVYNDEMRKQTGHEKNTLYNRLIADQQMIAKLYEVEQQGGENIQALDKFGVTNYFPYWLPAKISKKLKDPQFHSSFKYVIGLILFPLYYLILFIPVWILTDPGWIKWAFLASLPVTGFFAHTYFIWFKKLRSLWKYQFLTGRKDEQLDSLKNLRKHIIRTVDGLIRKCV